MSDIKIKNIEKKIEFLCQFMMYMDKVLDVDTMFLEPFDIEELDSSKIIYRTEDGQIFYEFTKWFEYIFSKKQKITDFYMGLTEYEHRISDEEFIEKGVTPSIVIQHGLFSFVWFVTYLEKENCYVLSEKFIDAVKYVSNESDLSSLTPDPQILSAFITKFTGMIKRVLDEPDSTSQSYKALVKSLCEKFNDWKTCKKAFELKHTVYMYATNEHVLSVNKNKRIQNAVKKIRERNIGCQEEFFIIADENGKLKEVVERKQLVSFVAGSFAIKQYRNEDLNFIKVGRDGFFDFLNRIKKYLDPDLKFICNGAAVYAVKDLILIKDKYDGLLKNEMAENIKKIKSMEDKVFFPSTMEDPKLREIEWEKYYLYDDMKEDDVRVLDEILGIENYMKVVRKFNGTYRPYKAINPEYFKVLSKDDALSKYMKLYDQNDFEAMCAISYFSKDDSFLKKAVDANFIPAIALAGEYSLEKDKSKIYLENAIKENYPLAVLSSVKNKIYNDIQETNVRLDKAAEILVSYGCEELAGECIFNQYLLNKFDPNGTNKIFEALSLGYRPRYLEDEWHRYRFIVHDQWNFCNARKNVDKEETEKFKSASEMYYEKKKLKQIRSRIKIESSQNDDIESIGKQLDDIDFARSLEKKNPQSYFKALRKLDGKGGWYSNSEYAYMLLTGKYGCNIDIRKCISILKEYPESTFQVQMLVSIYLSVLNQRHYSGMVRLKGFCHEVRNREYYDNDFSEIPVEEAVDYFKKKAGESFLHGQIMVLLYIDNVCEPQNEEDKSDAFKWCSGSDINILREKSLELREKNLQEQKEYNEKRSELKFLADEKKDANAMLEYAMEYLRYEKLKTPEGFEYIERSAKAGDQRAKSIVTVKKNSELSVLEKIKNAKLLLEEFKRNAFNGDTESLAILSKLYADGPEEIFDKQKAFCYEMMFKNVLYDTIGAKL